MRLLKNVSILIVLAFAAATAAQAQPRPRARAVLYEGARVIPGNGDAPIENAALLVSAGRIIAVGPAASVTAPATATHVSLAGKTVMPALVNAHVHIGYETYASWGAHNYGPQNVYDHLKREAYYGTGTVMSVGSDPVDAAVLFRKNQAAGQFQDAARFLAAPGMAPPKGGPDEILIEATSELHSVAEVSTPAEAKKAVRGFAATGIRFVKAWVDDRRGTYPKMPPEVLQAIIDEAHAHKMKAFVHATTLADQKAVIRAGADLVVHLPYDKEADDEYFALVKEKHPYIVPIIGLVSPSPLCAPDAFNEQFLPTAYIEKVKKGSCGAGPSRFDAIDKVLAVEVPKLVAQGARFTLGTDAGVFDWYSFGWAEHRELEWYVQLGMTPAQAIVAGTSRPAEMMGLTDVGTLAAGKQADFLVLNADPLQDIRNLRQIDTVYLKGRKLDRDALAKTWRARAGK